MEGLGHVESNEVFRKLAEVLADAVQRAVFAVSANISPLLDEIFATDMQWGRAYSSIMYRLSELLTKPLYLTMLG